MTEKEDLMSAIKKEIPGPSAGTGQGKQFTS
jgi:hypothetical protein